MIDPKTRIIAIIGSVAILLFVVELVRRRKLKEEYSILWITTALVLFVLSVWYELLLKITEAIGGVLPSSTLFFFGLIFVMLMLLHFSVRVSALERRLTALVQEIALLGSEPSSIPMASEVPERAPLAGADPVTDARVAVIIPCHNDGALVGDALASIQEDEPVEVVVVDDGSTDDETLERLAELARSGVTVVHRPNGGLGAARTTGLNATAAPYVYPLDADDRLERGSLAAMADVLDRQGDAGFVWGDYELFGDQRGVYRSPTHWLPWTLTYVNPYPVCSMFRREVLEQAEGWHGRAYEDWDLWLRLVKLGIQGVRIDRVVYHRRLHGDGRLLAQARQRHRELYEQIKRRNAAIFDARGDLRQRERPPMWKRAVYPVLFGSRQVVPYVVEAFLQRTMMRLGLKLPG